MAVEFNGTSDSLRVTGNAEYTPTTAMTVSLWIYFPTGWNTDGWGRVYEIGGYEAADVGGHSIERDASTSNLYWYRWASAYGNTSLHGTAFAVPTLDAWHHFICTVSSAGAAQVWVDGTSKGTASSATLAASTDGPMFACGNTTGGNRLKVRLAEFAVWSSNVSDGDRAALQKGFSPMCVRPDILTAYVPFVQKSTVAPDRVLTSTATVTGCTNVAHPPIIYPKTHRMRRFTTAAGGGATNLAWQLAGNRPALAGAGGLAG